MYDKGWYILVIHLRDDTCNRFFVILIKVRKQTLRQQDSLPDYVVMSDTINTFKNRLDAHWKHTNTFYFIIVQPIHRNRRLEFMFEYVKINECC